MKNTFLLFILVLTTLESSAQGSDNTPFNFTLQQAVDYAMANQVKVQNAKLDEDLARNKVREIRGIGMPQINGSFYVKDFWEIPTSLIPGEFFGAPKGTYLPVKFGTQFNTSAGLDASQLLFSSDYLVGLQATKVYYELMQKMTARSRIETSAMVQKAYYSVLVNEERFKLLEANVARIGKLKDDTKAMLDNGFVEQIDFDRINLTYNNLVIEKQKVERFVELGYVLLKYQMGMDQLSKLVLADKLSDVKFELSDVSTDKFDYSKRVEYSLLDSQHKGAELQLKKDKLSYLPNIALYSTLSAQAQRNKLDFWDTSKPWYPIGIIGVRIGVPIFDGFQKHYRIQQSKISLMKSDNDMKFLKQSIDLDLASAKTNLLNNATSLDTQKKNVELAQQVYNVSKVKYEQGVGSNLEVLNAENSLKESQTNYFSALYDALIAKVDFQKATGVLK